MCFEGCPLRRHDGAQALYECLLGGGRLAEQLHDAVHDFLLAGAPAAQPAAGAEPGPAAASYLRLAQRVLLLLPDADLLAFATRLLPWPGGAGARCRGAAGGGAPAQAVRLGRAQEPARRGAAWVALSCKPGSVGRRAGRACQPARLGRPPGPLLTCSTRSEPCTATATSQACARHRVSSAPGGALAVHRPAVR